MTPDEGLPLSMRPRGYRAILEAAEERFGHLGFQKAGVAEIAAQAGVSKPLIYRYFTSKKQLFAVVVDRVIGEWCEAIIAEGARATPSAAHSLRLIVRASLEFPSRRDVLRGLLAHESQLMLEGYSDVIERGTRTLHDVLTQALERGAREGDVRTDLDLGRMARLITEVCVRFGDRLLSGEVREHEPEMLDSIIETLLFGVIVQRHVPVEPTS